jgi:hypothetical protein
MVEFLEIKDEKILKYLLLIIIGYLIFKVFNTCGNGFNVGGAFGGTRCIDPYDPNDSNTYCENGDIKYKCNTIDVCNSYNSDDICTDSSSAYIGLEKNKCPSMNMPPYRETRMRDGASQNLLEHYCGTDPKYLSNYRDLILRGGETIIGPPNYVNSTWEGNDRCWTSPALTLAPTTPAAHAGAAHAELAWLVSQTQSVNIDSGYIQTLGDDGDAFKDCVLTHDEIMNDEDAKAFSDAFRSTIAIQTGVPVSDVQITDLRIPGCS